MPLPFYPPPGQIVVCDFEGMKAPEIVKRRPAIVISPKLRGRKGLCTVVPISTTEPHREMEHHFRLRIEPALPNPYGAQDVWVKCDMVYTVCFERLNLPWGRDGSGKRQFVNQHVSADDLQAIQRCMLAALGFGELARYL
ncbi:type II toxin-antitoxin system PemK/MazF family toxin [Pseudomonas aeruginosa]|uniref:type II toxin-antitoxin system PemK/MazF family toxin n=3 Tax=Pseudomonas aeruginosa TaxID=287 RepID=UPI000B493CBB|nr:type II toxin-antitoxin system PemK/MazF family toxin [Pseudomonas aeruginosa]EKX5129373.1 type II toxin-antitoxin system PemK/MazF family toxin [Pseudomonas aeruginosa]MCO3251659.1 type II toxin-antitoxin system PemK/MazF family toxin [Pseudomonas aeruginosa]PBN04504.1 hypothetical protein B8A54_02095 [Pseudomonas aeruginosa]QKZ42225.1 type II toxin-antitoxin system PemK/MazF family toxin [Pseudomonas aeruginosa]